MKKIISLLLVFVLLLSLCPVTMAEEAQTGSVQLKTLGNKLVFASDESVEVHLAGVNVCGSEWMANPESEKVKRGVMEAIYNWDCNIIRMGVSIKGWWGRYDWCDDGGYFYRSYVEDVIDVVRNSGKYIILDLHEYEYMSKEFAQFWREATETFGNNPAVMFGLLNEPCGDTTWETWRNGDGGDNVGLQSVVEMIRDMGAKNIIVAGGISYAGNLAQIGVENGYELVDQGSNGDTSKTGYGIMYDMHIYPAHGNTNDWDRKFGAARKKHPVIVGEYGWDISSDIVTGAATNPDHANYHTRWFPEMYDWMEDDVTYGSKANWTAWCFHPSSSPRMLEEYDVNGTSFDEYGYIFTPTEWFGQYVWDRLMIERGDNLALNKTIVSVTNGRPADSTDATFALDGDKTTAWKCANAKAKELIVDLGATYNINRWQVYHKNTLYNYSLMTSLDGESWTTVDTHINERAEVSDRYFKTTPARYVKLCIDDSIAICEVYDIRIIADNESDGHINADAPTDTRGIVLHEVSFDFYNGDTMPCWWTGGEYPVYIEGGAEDGIGSVMRFNGIGNRMMALLAMTNNADFSYFEYKYKSTYPVKVRFELDYRISDKETLKTNTITLPSTNDKWAVVRIYPEDLMPTASDIWVKTDLSTKTAYDAANDKYEFEPILISYMQTNNEGTADFEYFKAVWTMQNRFGFESVRVMQNGLACDSLKQGKADFYLRYNNQESRKLMYMMAAVAVYNAKGNLVSVSTLPFNAGIGVRTIEHRVTVDIPYDGCTAKVITWRTADGMEPITSTIEF